MCRVGIIGGTFDPIHLAHIYIAEEAKKKLEEYEKKDLLCEFGEVVVDDYECEDFEKSSTPARIIEDE